jgi:hypothetical protein
LETSVRQTTGDSAPIDETTGLVAMAGRQKGNIFGVRRTAAREHRLLLFPKGFEKFF